MNFLLFKNGEIDMTKTNDDTIGTLSVLNCREGDTTLNFNPESPADVQMAQATVEDMLKRGYMIFVQVGEETLKVEKFDPTKGAYIIKGREEVKASEVSATAIAPTGGG